jgi:carbon monoxide dehydrogenase subunit G
MSATPSVTQDQQRIELRNSATIDRPVAEVWAVLGDSARAASCVPGFELDGAIDDSTYQGRLRLPVGDSAVTFRGTVSVLESDQSARRIMLRSSGRELKGAGTLQATTVVILSDDGGATSVAVSSDVQLSGRPARLGSEALTRAGDALASRFGDNLSAEVTGRARPAATGADRTPNDDGGTPDSALTPASAGSFVNQGSVAPLARTSPLASLARQAATPTGAAVLLTAVVLAAGRLLRRGR